MLYSSYVVQRIYERYIDFNRKKIAYESYVKMLNQKATCALRTHAKKNTGYQVFKLGGLASGMLGLTAAVSVNN